MENRMETGADAKAAAQAAEATLIAAQNDAFRAAIVAGPTVDTPEGQVVMTKAVHAIAGTFRLDVMRAVAAFDTFTEDDDPYGDHSFGSLEVNGIRIFWKVDLYDLDYRYGSEAPADPTRTRRVLTIMFPSDW